ncbi:hypothetical protein SPRG_12538 [Saprolegnia parasitica CBS 223.65]|uniref:Uncharacterized protein n=1 Tax=Saprolegnia parasitica (strain CBS 223.65) TaxID=695850 RepID=A0A067BVK3_SAPPC|nr:hypothetical protein SPRG_12538 [Saprolegnia parasitica CBS 223.65]KDO22559.1 hypothetical protein SPRG_12538 [Saprolegnia parasitica CBS 223.65]|eukprot:XP_012206676.1 hypothetical protein SPRG_12538 [Saprolegnia parasitica CBS 223.65]
MTPSGHESTWKKLAARMRLDIRLVMRMLPVNSRLHYYIEHQEPAAILCIHGCGAVETEVHAFFACPYLEVARQGLARPFSGLASRISTSFPFTHGVQRDAVPIVGHGGSVTLIWMPPSVTTCSKTSSF